MAFDLSTNTIGVVAATVEGKTVQMIRSCPIIPPRVDATQLGYLYSKKKMPTPRGKSVNTYVRPGETTVTEAEKKRRDVEVRHHKDIQVLTHIGGQIDQLVRAVRPDLILVEQNCIFNGILTSVLLGKVMGTLLGVAGALSIPCREYPVQVVRKHLDPFTAVQALARRMDPDEYMRIPDKTKRALRLILEEKYGIQFQTDDESDACVVLDYWIEVVP